MAALTFVGALLVGRFIPPFIDPSDVADLVAAKYGSRAAEVRAGAAISAFGLSLILPFGIALAVQLRPTVGDRPTLTYVQIACVGVATVFVLLACTVWVIAVAIAIFGDRRARPAFPRWAGYLSLWLSVLIVAGAGMAFFKTGPFAYNGIMALYVPVAAFFVWVLAMTVLMLRNVRMLAGRLQGDGGTAGAAVLGDQEGRAAEEPGAGRGEHDL